MSSDPRDWHRYFAVEANNAAWDRAAGATDRDSRHELLNAAHAAAWHWAQVGTELNGMRASMLLAHAHALAGHGATALDYASEMREYFLGKHDTPDWETALAHTIFAHAAQAAGRDDLASESYARAKTAAAAIGEDEDRAIVDETLRQLPAR